MFIRLNLAAGGVAHVRATEIVGVIQGDAKTSVFARGDESPYIVVELAEDIVERITYVTKLTGSEC